ncbi:MAG: PIN domain-containing protein [Spirochaetaceae bacterium]|nr:PIN domain-containing protein [Spirochaetaceae bacterium]
MTESVFVDTNVLVYRYDASDPVKQARADAWYLHLWRRRCGRLSFQVLQEMYATLTRKLKPGIARSKAQRIVRALQAWQPITVDLSVLERAWNLQERHSLSWWDALIVAAAQLGACRVLLTEDLQHGQVFGGVCVIDPFASPNLAPPDVLEAVGS